MTPRSIIHLNIADFAARVETCLSPGLKKAPVVIAPAGGPRARVFDMNEQAFQTGVRKGMNLSSVKHRDPGIRILPPRFNRYAQVMRIIFKQALAYTPIVESGAGDGHFFLDITGTGRLYGPPPDVAFRLKKAILKEFGLDPIWSLATNKLVAKAATRMVKPVGEFIVGPGEEETFLAALPIELLPGLSKQEIQTITQFNLTRVAQAQPLTRAQLSIPFDQRAGRIHQLLHGVDPEPVIRSRAGAITVDHEFATETNEADELKAGLFPMVAALGRQARHHGLRLQKLVLSISYADGICCQKAMPQATTNDIPMFKQAWTLFCSAWKRRVYIRHLSLSCHTAPGQGRFQNVGIPGPGPWDHPARADRVDLAMDKIRSRFGQTAIQAGAALCNPGTTNRLKPKISRPAP
ncbi:MAG: hypothetical protein HUK40_07645 [Desulfobacter sp.]|nr:hypothetical protein [Desulfobacter sp.]WDP84228.1 MAG: hypothetical protein HUN05_02845 [Desulfobacter sp.]